MGVNRALSICSGLIKDKIKPIYTLGPLIHNKDVIKRIEEEGLEVEENINKIPDEATVLIRSHGIATDLKSKLKNKGIKIYDATCPKVAKVQGIIRNHVNQAYFILIIGDHEHAETKALISYTKDYGAIVANIKELNDFIALKEPEEKICVVAQTTQDEETFINFCELLKKHFLNLKVINTICDATRHRQEELRTESANYDRIIVVGGKHSANTTRLYELAKTTLVKNVNHIESVNDIDSISIENEEKIFITGGASTPLWLIYDIKKKLLNKVFIYKVLNYFTNKYISYILAVSSFLLYSYFNNYQKALTSILLLLAYIGLKNYHEKKIDVLFQKDFKVLFYISLILLFIQGINVNFKNIFFVFYYLILIYVIYINPIIIKELISLFCMLLFFILPLF